MSRKTVRKVALMMVMMLLPLMTTGCGGLIGGVLGGAARLIGGAGRLVIGGAGALLGGAGQLLGAATGIGQGFGTVANGPLAADNQTLLPGGPR